MNINMKELIENLYNDSIQVVSIPWEHYKTLYAIGNDGLCIIMPRINKVQSLDVLSKIATRDVIFVTNNHEEAKEVQSKVKEFINNTGDRCYSLEAIA